MRYYELNGIQYERISTILSAYTPQGLIDWQVKNGKKECDRILRETSKIGTRLHKLIEKYFKNGSYKLKKSDPIEVINVSNAFERFVHDYELKMTNVEETVYSAEWGVAGTYDFMGTVFDVPYLLDWKTSGRISQSYWIQLHAYAYMKFEGKVPDDLMLGVVRFDKINGDYEFCTMRYISSYLIIFLSLRNIYMFNKEKENDD